MGLGVIGPVMGGGWGCGGYVVEGCHAVWRGGRGWEGARAERSWWREEGESGGSWREQPAARHSGGRLPVLVRESMSSSSRREFLPFRLVFIGTGITGQRWRGGGGWGGVRWG